MSVEIRNLNKSYNGLQVVNNYSFLFEDGKIYCLFGPSGCGKTTLLHIIAGILPYDSGIVLGVENKKISMVFQEDRLLPWLTAEDNIKFVMAERTFDSTKYLRSVGLEEFKHYFPRHLSGGMKRRVALARAMAFNGQLILLDEPFKGIDDTLKMGIMNDIMEQKRNDQTIILTTHNLDEVRYMADEILYFDTNIK
ncbi:MAG TPA: ATP-binding cassette domain-containing protein [Candidatus Limnocylindrales bacterium]|nr:ATP-binding cassette domain-containing protein [Candidatus Limnocylindrales bacterium]